MGTGSRDANHPSRSAQTTNSRVPPEDWLRDKTTPAAKAPKPPRIAGACTRRKTPRATRSPPGTAAPITPGSNSPHATQSAHNQPTTPPHRAAVRRQPNPPAQTPPIDIPPNPRYTLAMSRHPAQHTRTPARPVKRQLCVLALCVSCGWLRLITSPRSACKQLSHPPHQTTHPIQTRNWYYFVAMVNVYPRLESEDLVDNLLEPVLRGLSPAAGVRTISDLRDDHLLWPPHVGLGVNLTTTGPSFSKRAIPPESAHPQRPPSLILLPLRTDFGSSGQPVRRNRGGLLPVGHAPRQESRDFDPPRARAPLSRHPPHRTRDLRSEGKTGHSPSQTS